MSLILEKYIFICHTCENYIAIYVQAGGEIPGKTICGNCTDERYPIPVGEKVRQLN